MPISMALADLIGDLWFDLRESGYPVNDTLIGLTDLLDNLENEENQ